jgi:hypothetical protein
MVTVLDEQLDGAVGDLPPPLLDQFLVLDVGGHFVREYVILHRFVSKDVFVIVFQ